ncbi:molybdate ABC transporter substrate-binding protein [Ureibacillus aquaedulcis]|uniref:Molybdate ABC transporter substrate-binding protein n=1 Tax=Ureibacillus aquaedulcis TaxID=3058421 RepID=A0ABT8GP81_9BACL|nr:molybdate ABC transporter substrate-binding protein [Ureibacillus sp. BA0131]MDN4492716.1 molybdate ABC transporter substrate-binding protein [Ureibacillus sp. BA0131]
MRKLVTIFSIILTCIIGGCASASSEKENSGVLTISAASSLQDVLEEMAAEFNNKPSNLAIQYNFGATGSLVKQIEQGAPVDLFISASREKFDELSTKGFIQESAAFISNELVLVTTSNGKQHLENLDDLKSSEVEKISIGTPSTVPAGSYAEQSLKYFDLWSTIEGKLVYAKDVRQVLTYVETGNVQAGFVYKTDAINSDKVKIAVTLDEDSHDSITYPIGIIQNTDSPTAAKQFYDFLQSDEGKEIWAKYGFTFIR